MPPKCLPVIILGGTLKPADDRQIVVHRARGRQGRGWLKRSFRIRNVVDDDWPIIGWCSAGVPDEATSASTVRIVKSSEDNAVMFISAIQFGRRHR